MSVSIEWMYTYDWMMTLCVCIFYRNGHMMTHRSKKPFECKFEGCDKSYCDARSLRRHLENTHQHEMDAASQYNFGGEQGTAATQVRGVGSLIFFSCK